MEIYLGNIKVGKEMNQDIQSCLEHFVTNG